MVQTLGHVLLENTPVHLLWESFLEITLDKVRGPEAVKNMFIVFQKLDNMWDCVGLCGTMWHCLSGISAISSSLLFNCPEPAILPKYLPNNSAIPNYCTFLTSLIISLLLHPLNIAHFLLPQLYISALTALNVSLHKFTLAVSG